jgi:hypothetical protein
MRATLLVLVAAVGLLCAATASAAGPAPQTIDAWFLTIGKSDKPVHVVAKGPIHGIGFETQTEKQVGKKQVNYTTLHFDRGSVRLVAPERFDWKMDQKQCLGHANGGGTYTIVGGTGAYAGATGKGTFKTVGIAFAQRSPTGACRGLKTPISEMVFYVKLTATGTAALR